MLTWQERRFLRLFYDRVKILNFTGSSALFHRFGWTPRPARLPSLRTTRFRHGNCMSHYSVQWPDYTVLYKKLLPAKYSQHHPRIFSSSFLSLCTTFSLRKSLSPNLQLLASSYKHGQDQTHIPSLVTTR